MAEEHSPKFDLVKSYYDRGLWSADRVRKAVGKWITAEECAEILGLGRSKEARHLNYQAKLLGADSLDEARDDDDFGEAPSQQEIEEADDDLNLDDDSDLR